MVMPEPRPGARPLLPDTFNGAGEISWGQWIYHFGSMARVNGWDAEDKIKWLKACLIGRTRIIYQLNPRGILKGHLLC